MIKTRLTALLLTVVVVVALFLIGQFGFVFPLRKMGELNEDIEDRRKALREMQQLEEKSQRLSRDWDRWVTSAQAPDPFDTAKQIAEEVGVEHHLSFHPEAPVLPEAKVSRVGVEVHLEQVRVDEVVNFLRRLEGSAPGFLVSDVRLFEDRDRPGLFEATFFVFRLVSA